MFMKDAGHMPKLIVAGRRSKSHPRPPIRSHGRKLFMLDIATVNPLLFYETGSKCTGGYYGCKLLWVFNEKRLII